MEDPDNDDLVSPRFIPHDEAKPTKTHLRLALPAADHMTGKRMTLKSADGVEDRAGGLPCGTW